MNKMNKKGFTLIEMLVVIAIIAVLVSIIVPVVNNASEKANAAANAANLRALQAEAVAASLAGETTTTTNLEIKFTEGNGMEISATDEAPKSKAAGDCPEGCEVAFDIDPYGTITAYYSDPNSNSEAAEVTYTVAYFASIAEDGTAATTEPTE